MFIGEHVEIKFNNPEEEVTVGLRYEKVDGFPFDEITNEPDFTVEPVTIHTFTVGLLIFNVIFYWKW